LTFEKVFHKHSIGIEVHDFNEIYHPINERYWKLYREEKVTKSQLRYGRLKESFDLLSYTVSDELIDILAVDYIEHLADFNHVFEHTYEILAYLVERYELHIITNGFNEIQYRKMESSKLTPFFKQVITSEQVGVKKPNPKIFYYAMEMANAKPEESMMLGDNAEADIEGAKLVGMQAIHCRLNGEKNVNGNVSVKSLIELKKYL
jgi:putative hydrolase of the HAD superfamily